MGHGVPERPTTLAEPEPEPEQLPIRHDRGAHAAALAELAEPVVEAPRPSKLPLQSLRQPLPDDLEREFQAAIGSASMEELVAKGGGSGPKDPNRKVVS